VFAENALAESVFVFLFSNRLIDR